MGGERKYSKKSLISYISVIIIAIASSYFFICSTGTDEKLNVDNITDGWTIIYEDNIMENMTIAETDIKNIKKGQTVVMSNVFPDNQIWGPVLEFKTSHAVVWVYCDEELIYSYGQDEYDNNKLVGYGYHFIQLPDDYGGKSITIKLMASVNGAFSGLSEVKVIQADQLFKYKMSKERVSLAMALFLITLGIIMFILSLAMDNDLNVFHDLLCLSALALSCGCWAFCNKNLINIFTNDLVLKVHMEYISLYFVLIPFLGCFISAVFSPSTPKIFKQLFKYLLSAVIVTFVISVILDVTGTVYLPRFLLLEHLLMLLTVIYLAVFEINKFIRKDKININILVGFTIALLLSTYELVKFDIMKYFVGFKANNYNSYIDLAALIMVVTMFWDFFRKTSETQKEEAIKDMLTELAFKDELTGLANRRRCDDVIKDYFKEKRNFTVISFDMNFLKKINDTYGHEIGDKALVQFANELKKTFPTDSIIGRMGGDEFVVIVNASNEKQIVSYIDKLKESLTKFNFGKNDNDIPLSAAYGYAFSNEYNNVHEIMKCADSRMYQNKRESKNERK